METLQITDSMLAATFQRENWRVSVQITAPPLGGGWIGFAELSRDGAARCRITLAGPYACRENVVAALECKAREVIEAWRVCEHSPEP